MDEEGKGNIFCLRYIDLISLINSPSCSYVFLYRYVRSLADEIILQGHISLSLSLWSLVLLDKTSFLGRKYVHKILTKETKDNPFYRMLHVAARRNQLS